MSLSIVEYTSIATIIGGIVGIGITFGLLKGKVSELSTSINNKITEVNNTITTKGDLYTTKSDALQKQVDSMELDIKSIKKENNLAERYIDTKYDAMRTYVDTEMKVLNRDVQDLKGHFFSRGSHLDMVPVLAEKVKQLEIEVGVLPAKLSEELSKAFSDEYKNLVNALSDKKN